MKLLLTLLLLIQRAGPAPGPAPSPAPPPAPVVSQVPNVAPVTADNPVLVISSKADTAGLKLELMVVNKADKLLPFKFNSSKTYEFVITDPASGQEIWRSSHGMMFAQVIRTDSIRGSGDWTFSEVWNRRDNDQNPVPPGQYRLVGILASQPPISSKAIMVDVPAAN